MEIRKEIVEIVDSLGKKDSQLTQVDLNLVGISDAELSYLINPLLRSKTVTTLILSNNKITKDSMPFLAELLKKSKTINYVSLSYNKLEAKGAQILAQALAEGNTLTALDLWNCGIADAGAIALCSALLSNRKTQLRSLDLSTNELTDDAGSKLAEYLSQNLTIRQLRLNNNQLSDKSGLKLAEALKHASHLEVLDLSRNKLTDKAAAAMANNLLKNAKANTQSLRILDLSENLEVTDTTAEKLANLLFKDHRLETVRLAACSITDAGAAALFVSLETNQTLRQLDLSGTKITENSLKACIEMLKVNVSLCRLNLPDKVKISETVLRHLAFNDAIYIYLSSYRSVLARFQDAINGHKPYGDLAQQYIYECEELLRFLHKYQMDPIVQEKCNNLYQQCIADMRWAQKTLKSKADISEMKIAELLKNELEPKLLTLPIEPAPSLPSQPAADKMGLFGIFSSGVKVDPVQQNINQVVAELLGSLLQRNKTKVNANKQSNDADYFTDMFSLLADLRQEAISLTLLHNKYDRLQLNPDDWKKINLIQKILRNAKLTEDISKNQLRYFLPEEMKVNEENYQKIRQGLINGLQWHIDNAEETKRLIIIEVPARTGFYVRNFIGQTHENLHVELLKALRSHEIIRAGIPLPKQFPEDVFIIEMTGLMRDMMNFIPVAKKSSTPVPQATDVTLLMTKYRHLRLGFKEWESLQLLKAILENEKLPESPIVVGQIKDKFLPANVQLNRETYNIIRQSLISEMMSLVEELPKMILPAKELSEQEKEIEKEKEAPPIVVDQETIERQIPFLTQIYLGTYIALLMPTTGNPIPEFYKQTADLYTDLLKRVNQSVESRTEAEEHAFRASFENDLRLKNLTSNEKNELILAILCFSHVELPKSQAAQQLLMKFLPAGAPVTEDNYQLIRQAFIEHLSQQVSYLNHMAVTPSSGPTPK